MFLAGLAFVIAVFALIRSRGLSTRVKRLEENRVDLLGRLDALQRLLDRQRTPTAPASPESESREREVAPSGPEPRLGPASASTPVAPPKRPPASSPARPAPPEHPPIPEPPSPPIDWESLLGVKGAAWVGGIALITSAIFFARWTIDQGLLTPQLRFTLMVLAGVSALAAAEIGLRKGYERTANPLSGAGIAILYVAFFAGHSRYELISLPAAFAGMVFVTVAACVLSVRYDAFPTAVLGLLGGFATPVALSTGEDRPVGLFSYILVLNLGLLAVGAKRRWPGLFELGLLGTLMIQMGWFSKFMSPGNLLVGLVAFLGLGLVYLTLPLVAGEQGDARVLRTGAIGGVMPFLFTLNLAGSPPYVDQWSLLFGMVALLDLAILAVAVLRGRVGLLLSASVASLLTLVVWAAEGLKAEHDLSLLAVTVFAIAIVSVFGGARRVALRFGDLDEGAIRVMEVSALVAWAGLGAFGLIMIGHDRGAPAAPFLALTTALLVLLIERTYHRGRLRGALSLGSTGLAALVQLWLLASATGTTLVPSLAVPVLCSVVLSFLAARGHGGKIDVEAELAVRAFSWISIFGLIMALAQSGLARDGWPLFMALLAHGLVVVGSVLRSNWTIGLPALLGASAFHLLIWQLAYMKPDQHRMSFGFGALFFLFFVALPMVVPFARWREALLPWLTSALAGPVFFLPLYHVYREAFGETAIGLLPLGMAGVSLVSLQVVAGRFTIRTGDAVSARLRLRYLALFSAVALWFVAVAIPLQLHRQWITLGWAIEAMALCWLYGRLPHRGLPVFAFLLYGLVGVRLLLNPEVLRYHERGLPMFNWILYTYATAAACCLLGQSFLRSASEDALIRRMADAIALNGLLLGFWLVNLEILDYYSPGSHIAISGQSGYSVKLALSAGWGLYALVLLAVGVAKNLKPLRYLSLAFLLLTVAKVFLYDLSELGGIFRVFSFLGLAVGLILVSLFYQRFVFKKNQ